MDDLILTANQPEDGWLVLTHTPTGITIEFERGRFNETQRVVLPSRWQQTHPELATTLPSVLSAMADWMATRHRIDAMPSTDFASTCRTAIQRRGLKASAVAEAVGISQPTLSRFLTGRGGLEMAALQRLLDFLGLSVG